MDPFQKKKQKKRIKSESIEQIGPNFRAIICMCEKFHFFAHSWAQVVQGYRDQIKVKKGVVMGPSRLIFLESAQCAHFEVNWLP